MKSLLQSKNLRALSLVALALSTFRATMADTVIVGTLQYEGTVNGIRNGMVSLTLKTGAEKQLEVSEIGAISLDQWPAFAQAEAARDDALKASALYKALIPTLNKPDLKLLAQCRAIDPMDRNGLWTDAMALFLEVYQTSPADPIWKLRPTHFPAAGSRMLSESADRVAAAIKAARSDDARKNLRGYLLEIYTKAGDAPAAERVAREISTGIAEDPHAPTPPPPDAAAAAVLSQLEGVLRAGNFDQVIQQSDAHLATVTGDAAVQFFALKARALEAQGNLESAAAVWLRIPAHYPASPAAPTALRHAATLQQKLNHADAAKVLTDEIRTAYPDSPEASSVGRP